MKITIDTLVKADMASVWNAWNNPNDIKQWNAASDDWHTTQSTVELKVGGKFCSRMEAKDGSMGFDFEGTYTVVDAFKKLEYTLGDDRMVQVSFEQKDTGVLVSETFDTENENSAERQKQGWQAILNNFARHVESKQTYQP